MATVVLTPPPTGLIAATPPQADGGDAPTVLGTADSQTILSGPEDGATTFAPAEPATVLTPAPPTKFAAGDPTLIPGIETISPTIAGGGAATDAGSAGGDPSDHGPLNVGQVFGTRYHIIKLLGVGGMGAVYQAWDQELAVAVAIKVIRPEVLADPIAAADIERRFKRELLLAREVTHKNVVRIHDLGEINGIKYITMAYVNGSDLATLIRRQGRVPAARVLRIARSVVSGLVAAHTANVVHRDLKPANIMVDAQDEALIMDFGIARSTAEPVAKTTASRPKATPPGRPVSKYTDATAVGSIVGTVEYMAPEQAKGLEVDQRADVYAFGLILYDMLTGRRRAQVASSAFSELQARMEQAPPPVRSIVPDVPEALDRLVLRCVEPDREKRFESTADVQAELDRLDENGEPIPVRRVFGIPVLAAVVVLAAALLGGGWWYARQLIPAAQHDPVSVLIADFQNKTGDPEFDRTLEPMLKLALEGAGFVSAYDRNAIGRSLGVRPPENLDERAAQEIAVKQGLGVVLSGALERQGSRYVMSVKATHAVTGNVIATAKDRASSKEQVLGAATKLATAVREALGDDTSEADQRFGMETLSATSLEAVRDYAAAAQAMSNSRFEDALTSFSKAIERDPKFGLAYAGMAIASRNLDKQQDAEKYIKEAVSHLDGMTERERYRTRGLFYYVTGDYQQCVKEFGDLITRYAADASARNNLALCLTYLRNMPRAVDEMRQVVKILPKRALYRENLALYADYSSDFRAAEEEARSMEHPGLLGVLALAFSQIGQGQLPDAIKTYETLGKFDALGVSYSASGSGDLALYEGRLSDAERIFAEGAAADLTSKDSDRAANKFAALAYTRLLLQQKGAAVAAAEKALANSKAVKIRFLAARIFVEAGVNASARTVIGGLASELQAEPQAYAKILEGEAALKKGEARQAIKALTEANTLLDTWMGHFDLGRAYLEAGAYTQADSEFDRCIKRRGEVLALFLDEEPTYGYLPPVFYYQGRAREGLKTAGFAESYRTYLTIRGQSKEDSLLPEVRRRAGSS